MGSCILGEFRLLEERAEGRDEVCSGTEDAVGSCTDRCSLGEFIRDPVAVELN